MLMKCIHTHASTYMLYNFNQDMIINYYETKYFLENYFCNTKRAISILDEENSFKISEYILEISYKNICLHLIKEKQFFIFMICKTILQVIPFAKDSYTRVFYLDCLMRNAVNIELLKISTNINPKKIS